MLTAHACKAQPGMKITFLTGLTGLTGFYQSSMSHFFYKWCFAFYEIL
jgi:hypothetical protein